MKKPLLIILFFLIASVLIAYSTSILLGEVNQLGGTEKEIVNKYNIRVISISLNVSKNIFKNQITSIAISVASSNPGYYNVYATLSSGTCSVTASWINVYLSTTPTPLSYTLQSRCDYDPPGATVKVRGVPV